MPGAFVKRVRMSRPLAGWLPAAALPHGFYWQPWHDSLLDAHAGVKYLSFAETVDAQIFRNLSGLTGCRMLMHAIRNSDGFCPQATWLICNADGAVGTIQGVIDDGTHGGIQNLGVLRQYRRQGFGSLLVAKALYGFRAAGATTAYLEVTATNPNAMRLYRRLGFKPYNSFYRERDRVSPAMAGAGI